MITFVFDFVIFDFYLNLLPSLRRRNITVNLSHTAWPYFPSGYRIVEEKAKSCIECLCQIMIS